MGDRDLEIRNRERHRNRIEEYNPRMGESRRSSLDYETDGRERYIERNSEFNPRMGDRRSGPDIETRNLERGGSFRSKKSDK